jgi:hypothetical protein
MIYWFVLARRACFLSLTVSFPTAFHVIALTNSNKLQNGLVMSLWHHFGGFGPRTPNLSCLSFVSLVYLVWSCLMVVSLLMQARESPPKHTQQPSFLSSIMVYIPNFLESEFQSDDDIQESNLPCLQEKK